MNKTSSLYQEVGEEEINEIFQYVFPDIWVKQANLLKGGLYNTTYGVKYGEDGEEAVLRLGPVNCHLLMGFEKNLMEAEKWVYGVMGKRGIPCPQVLFCDVSQKRFSRDIMITGFKQGNAMNDVLLCLEEKDRKKLHEEAGRYMAALHTVTGTEFGYVSRVLNGEGSPRWSQALLREMEDILGRLLTIKAVTEDEAALVRAAFAKYRDLLDEVGIPHLLHGDLWEGNLLAEKQGDGYRITAVLDADRCVMGDIDFELATPWMTTEAFLRGYGIDMQDFEQPKRRKRRKLYRLYLALVDTYVGAGEYNNEEQYRENRESTRRLAEEILGGT